MLPSEIPKLPLTGQWEGFLVFANFSFFTIPSLEWVSIPNSFVSLFVFYILFCLLLKRMCYLSGCLVISASIQKLFCGNCSAFKWSFDEFVGEKVVSLSYSSVILGPPLFYLHFSSFWFWIFLQNVSVIGSLHFHFHLIFFVEWDKALITRLIYFCFQSC